MLPTTPEDIAREQIDTMLTASGWKVQDRKDLNLSAAFGVAVREVTLDTGEPDYLLFADGKAIATVEAKKAGYTLSGVEEQSAKYATGANQHIEFWKTPIPFSYESTGVETRFTNHLDPVPRSREVFSFHKPETLLEWVQREDSLPGRLQRLPPLIDRDLWAAQKKAIINLEKSLAKNNPRALIQMATGSGKTFTAVNFCYRLVKHADAKRILFLVDRGNLGEQTLKEFQQYITPDDGRKFNELYNIQHLRSNKIDPVARVTISTIQRLYSILKGEEETAPDLDDLSIDAAESIYKEPLPVAYNPKVPIETFDIIVTDECHRSIYNLWRQVLEYFDAHIIGLTATPSKQTFGFFNQNLVMEYPHQQAVADGVNVNYDVFRIRTKVTEKGGQIKAGYYVDRRDRLTRKKRWEKLDDDLVFEAKDLDREVVVDDQIRTVLKTYRDSLPVIFPGREHVPKTLIYAKDDSHAEDIVRICREVFGKGNDFCQKITYRTTGVAPSTLIAKFRNAYDPRIAVTVDMIATGTDIKPLEVVFFMRSVKSRSFFEQMKGRGVRVISDTEFQSVTPDAVKTHFIIVDAVGVCERDKTDSAPLEKKRTLSFEKLLEAAAYGNKEPELVSSLAGRLLRLERRMDEPLKKALAKLAGGKSINALAHDLLNAIDPDVIQAGVDQGQAKGKVMETLAKQALAPIAGNPKLRNKLIDIHKAAEQTIDRITGDSLISAGADKQTAQSAKKTVKSFREYIEENKKSIETLQILYRRPYRRKLTEESLRDLEAKLKEAPAHWTVGSLSNAYRQVYPQKVKGNLARFTDLVSIVRFALEQEPLLEPFEHHVKIRFAEWLAQKKATGAVFGPDELNWLEKMRDCIAASGSVDKEYFEISNELGQVYKVFGEKLWPIMEELNLALAA
jgi:type I restriction enzyme R subunit